MDNNDDIIEVLEYKLEEVSEFYSQDIGELPPDTAIEINNILTDPNEPRKRALDKAIRSVYILLLNGNIKNINNKINKSKGVDFSKIEWEINQFNKKLKKPQEINELKGIYINELKPIMLSTAEKHKKEHEKEKEKRNNRLIALIFTIIGIVGGAILCNFF